MPTFAQVCSLSAEAKSKSCRLVELPIRRISIAGRLPLVAVERRLAGRPAATWPSSRSLGHQLPARLLCKLSFCAPVKFITSRTLIVIRVRSSLQQVAASRPSADDLWPPTERSRNIYYPSANSARAEQISLPAAIAEHSYRPPLCNLHHRPLNGLSAAAKRRRPLARRN